MEREFTEFYQTQKFVNISSEKIQEFVNSFHNYEDEFKQKIRPLKVPLNFENVEDECNFFGICCLLAVGSAYDHRSNEAQQDHLSDIILAGVFGAYISHSHLNAKFMKSVTASDAGQYFSLPCTERVKLAAEISSFATMEQPGGLIALAELYSKVLMNCGLALERRGYQSVSVLLFEYLHGNCTSEGLIQTLRSLSSVFPQLDDRHIITIQSKDNPSSEETIVELSFFTSLRRLLFDLCHRFDENIGHTCVQGISCNELHHLAAAPSVRTINALLRLNILNSTEISNSLNSSDQVAYEVAMRASSVCACEQIAEAILEKYPHLNRNEVNPLSISIYLDNLDKIGEPMVPFIPHKTGLVW